MTRHGGRGEDSSGRDSSGQAPQTDQSWVERLRSVSAY